MSSSVEARFAALESRIAALEQSKVKAKSVKEPKSTAEAAPLAEPKEPKEKSAAQSAWNEQVSQTVADMRQNGWPAWTSLTDDTVFAASELKGGKHVFSAGTLVGKEASHAMGGLARASFLKLEADPVAAAKARESRVKRLAKVAENASKKSGSSTGSAEKAAPVADAVVVAAPVAETPKKVLSPEHKAAMQAGRLAAKMKRAAEAEAPAASNAAAAPASAAAPAAAPASAAAPAKPAAPKPVKAKKVVSAPVVVKKELDLNFSPWTHEGTEYIKNERGDVLSYPEAEWVGRFDGKKIDESVARPDDIDEFLE